MKKADRSGTENVPTPTRLRKVRNNDHLIIYMLTCFNPQLQMHRATSDTPQPAALRISPHPGIIMLILLKVAPHSFAKTPICAPLIECVMREVSALQSSM